MGNRGVILTVNASGAAAAAEAGNVVVIVDVIDMSTTLEAALDAGASHVLGASPDLSRAPVKLCPGKIGQRAAQLAREAGTDVIVVCEPRIGTEEDRRDKASRLLKAIADNGAKVEAILPNAGAEVVKMADFKGKVVVVVSDTGGVSFDAAYNAGAPSVLTGTVARTMQKRGPEPARAAAKRAVDEAVRLNAGIAVVAASANSLEDLLAAEYIYKEIIAQGFTAL